MAIKRDPFKVLGIDRTKYNDADLKQLYLDLIRKYNPEKRPEKFEEIRSAYNLIKNSKSPYDVLAVAPVELTTNTMSREDLSKKLEEDLGIKSKKINFKKTMLLKKLEDIINDSGN